MRRIQLIIVAVMISTMVINAQSSGDFAIGANATYGFKDQKIATGIKVQYNFTDWLRTEVAGDYWLKKGNWEAFDALINIHGLIPMTSFMKFYPIAGVGLFSVKLSELDYMDSDYRVHVHFDGKSENDLVGVGGLGLQFCFTNHIGMNIEGKYQFNVGNQFIGTVGLVYIF